MGNLQTDFLQKTRSVQEQILRGSSASSFNSFGPPTNRKDFAVIVSTSNMSSNKRKSEESECNIGKNKVKSDSRSSSHSSDVSLMLSKSSYVSSVFKEATPRCSLTITDTSLMSNRKAFSMINIYQKSLSNRNSLTPNDARINRPRSSLNSNESTKLYSFHWRRRSTSTGVNPPRWAPREFR